MALPVDAGQEAGLLEAFGEGFQIRRTPHFLVVFNTDPRLVQKLAIRLEDTYRSVYRFVDMVGIETRRPAKRLEVILFDRREDYERYGAGLNFKAGGTYGVYHERTNRSAFFNVHNDPTLQRLHADIAASREGLESLTRTLDSIRGNQPVVITYGDGRQEMLTRAQARKRLDAARRELRTLDGRRVNYSERINRTVIQHEAAHQVLFNAGVHVRGAANPKWIVEGLACLFETPPGAAGTGIATTNQHRLRDFRTAVAGGADKRVLTVEDFLEAIDTGRLVAPERLIGDPRVFEERGAGGAAAYATAWSLTGFLQRRYPRQLAGYLRELSARTPGTAVTPAEELELFEKHFGLLNDAFVRQWGLCTLQLPYRAGEGL